MPRESRSKLRIQLVHWNAAEAALCAKTLAVAGYDVAAGPIDGKELRRLRSEPPAVFVIDLSRPAAAPPVVPASVLAGYSGTPLPKKLGIKESATVTLAGAPRDFEETLGALPESSLQPSPSGRHSPRGLTGHVELVEADCVV
jgi:hypothetical protein